jgi:hypothetical protein
MRHFVGEDGGLAKVAKVDVERAMGERSAITVVPDMRARPLLLLVLVPMMLVASEPASAQSMRSSFDLHVVQVQYQPVRPRLRPRPRIEVTPLAPYSSYSTPYPKPYTYEYPGPGHVRQCSSWLAQEARPSGTVIVPRMRCWWVPGSS